MVVSTSTLGTSTSIETSPPTPTWPASVQSLHWIGRPYEFLDACAKKFGDTFALNFGPQGKYVIFSHPDATRRIFTADASVLHVGPGNAVLGPLVGPTSLLLLEGQRHLQERRLLLPAFHQKTILRYGSVIREVLTEATASWSANSEFVAQDFLQGVSIDVIMRAVFGISAGTIGAELKSEVVALLRDKQFGLGTLGRLGSGATHPMLANIKQRVDRVRQLTLMAIVDRRRAVHHDADDMLSLLLAATDELGRQRSDEEIRDELLTLVVTGHDTTATALAWGLYWIATHPEVKETLRIETAQLGPTPDSKAYTQLEYLDATCKEILRIYPIVPAVFRQAIEPFSVGGYVFEPGTILSPNIYLTHQREDIYPEGHLFKPDRFLTRTYSPYEYLPFGGGVRRCLGMQLAVYEMKVVIATLLRRYEFALVPGQKVVPIRRNVTIAPSTGPRMLVQKVLF